MSTLTHAASLPCTRETSLVRKALAAVAGAFNAWRRRIEMLAELNGLNDRELADIGLHRGDIKRLIKGESVPATERRAHR